MQVLWGAQVWTPFIWVRKAVLRWPPAQPLFPQVYHLASVRLRDLCAKLDISDELRKRIWTCFEHSLVHCPEIMMDRHLDQLLMCAIYVMAKVRPEWRKNKQTSLRLIPKIKIPQITQTQQNTHDNPQTNKKPTGKLLNLSVHLLSGY